MASAGCDRVITGCVPGHRKGDRMGTHPLADGLGLGMGAHTW